MAATAANKVDREAVRLFWSAAISSWCCLLSARVSSSKRSTWSSAAVRFTGMLFPWGGGGRLGRFS